MDYKSKLYGKVGRRIYVPLEMTADDCDELLAERDQLAKDLRELMEALEELTATCESNHRIAYIGWSYDKYSFAYETQVSNPVKRARATLDKIKAREDGDDTTDN